MPKHICDFIKTREFQIVFMSDWHFWGEFGEKWSNQGRDFRMLTKTKNKGKKPLHITKFLIGEMPSATVFGKYVTRINFLVKGKHLKPCTINTIDRAATAKNFPSSSLSGQHAKH